LNAYEEYNMSSSREFPWMNSFDVWAELSLNHFFGQHPWFDRLICMLAETVLSTSVVVCILMWFLLFDRSQAGQMRRGSELILGSAFTAILATFVARVLALSLPFRTRPISTPSLRLSFPFGMPASPIHWSAFPSDHATLFFALAGGIFMVSRRLGWFAIAWVSLAICFPLVYLGIHWPTDIFMGAALGLAIAQIARIQAFRAFVQRKALVWHQNHPLIFASGIFLLCYDIATVFSDYRHLLHMVIVSI
jgi:undecaprenyl-diphosphatase